MPIEIRVFQPEDEKAVVQLWHDCGLVWPDDDPFKDIQRKQSEHPELFFVAHDNGKLVGTVMGGYDGHRGAINYLGVSPGFQRRGIGQLLMTSVEKKILALGCPKINLFVRVSNKAVRSFYEKLGYSQNAQALSFGKRFVDDQREVNQS